VVAAFADTVAAHVEEFRVPDNAEGTPVDETARRLKKWQLHLLGQLCFAM